MLGLGLHLLHEPGTLDDVAEAGIVFDVGRRGQLPARGDPLDEDRLEPGAGGVDCSRIAGRARTQHRQARRNAVCHAPHLGALETPPQRRPVGFCLDPAAGDEIPDENDDADDQQDVNEPAGNMECEESQRPQDEKDNCDRQKHTLVPCLG